MGKRDSKMYYAPLQAYFNDEMMSIDRFANIEAPEDHGRASPRKV